MKYLFCFLFFTITISGIGQTNIFNPFNFDDYRGVKISKPSTSDLNIGDTAYTFCYTSKFNCDFDSIFCPSLDSILVAANKTKGTTLRIYYALIMDSTELIHEEAFSSFHMYYRTILFTKNYFLRDGFKNRIACYVIYSDSAQNHQKYLSQKRKDFHGSFAYIVLSDTATDEKYNWIEKNKELSTKKRFFISGRCLPDTRSYPFYSDIYNFLYENEKSIATFNIYTPVSEVDSAKSSKIKKLESLILKSFQTMPFEKRVKSKIHWEYSDKEKSLLVGYVKKITISFVDEKR